MAINMTPSDSELQPNTTNDVATSEIQGTSLPKSDTSRELDSNQHSAEQVSQTSKDAGACTEGHEAGDDHPKPTPDKDQTDEVEKTKVEEKTDAATDEQEQDHNSPTSENEDLVSQVSAQLTSVTLNDEGKGTAEDKEDEPLLEPKDGPRSESESKLDHGPDLPEPESESKPELEAGPKSETGPESERKLEHESEHEYDHESEREHAPQPDSEAEPKSHEDKPQESLNDTATEPATPTHPSVSDQDVRDSAQEQISLDRQRLVLIFSYVDHLQASMRRRDDPKACIAIKRHNREQCWNNWDIFQYPNESHLCEVHKKFNFLGGHIFRSSLSEAELYRFLFPVEVPTTFIDRAKRRSKAISILYNNRAINVFDGSTFDALTSELEPRTKRNIRRLIKDFFDLTDVYKVNRGKLTARHNRNCESYFARKRKYKPEEGSETSKEKMDAGQLKTQLKARGHVYITLHPCSEETKEVVEASVALKIGFSTRVSGRLVEHAQCGLRTDLLRTFPRMEESPMPFAHLFEKVIHELLVAHQYDIWCRCGSTHVEMFLFERIEGDHNGTISYRKTMDRLAPTFEKWMKAFQDLEDLHTKLFGTSSDPDSLADVLRGIRLY